MSIETARHLHDEGNYVASRAEYESAIEEIGNRLEYYRGRFIKTHKTLMEYVDLSIEMDILTVNSLLFILKMMM